MTRDKVLLTVSMPLLMGAAAIAQTPAVTAPVPGQRGGAAAGDVLSILPMIYVAQGQRSATVVGPQTAWWTDSRLVAQLGLSDDQMQRIERAFEAHRPNLVSGTRLLEQEETQLQRMLEAEPVDRAGISTQINRVIQARGDVERTNAAMTLEMREHLTRGQWMQLQASQRFVTARVISPATPNPQAATPLAGGPPASSPASAVTRIGRVVAQQNLISSVKPEYPPLARAARIQGIVILEATISQEGSVTDAKVVSGHPLLVDSATRAVKQWRYRPFLMNGVPIVATTTIEVPFNLQ